MEQERFDVDGREREPRSISFMSPQLILGLAAMLLGLVLVAENVGLMEARRLVRYWPILLIAVGLARVVESLRTRGPLAGHVMAATGVVLLLINIRVVRPSQALAAALLLGGAMAAWRAARRPRLRPGLALEGGRLLELASFMAYTSRSVSSPAFAGGNVSAVMGACEVDLRSAQIVDGEAVIDVFAFWGGIEIRVPEDWQVEARGTAILGALDASRAPRGLGPRLTVTGIVIMGGVEIRS